MVTLDFEVLFQSWKYSIIKVEDKIQIMENTHSECQNDIWKITPNYLKYEFSDNTQISKFLDFFKNVRRSFDIQISKFSELFLGFDLFYDLKFIDLQDDFLNIEIEFYTSENYKIQKVFFKTTSKGYEVNIEYSLGNYITAKSTDFVASYIENHFKS